MQNAFDKRKEELKEFSEALEKLDIRKKEEAKSKQAPDDSIYPFHSKLY